jgi:periplasmic protein TonB
MDYRQQQEGPSKHLTGIAFVVVLHALLGWALYAGLGKAIIDKVKEDIKTVMIEEVKPPPPPPPPPPVDMMPPPQVQTVFVPPPEVSVTPPPVVTNAIVAPTTPVAPVFAPPAPPAPPTAAAAPAVVAAPSVGTACPNSQEIRANIKYPPQAQRDGVQGEVVVEFTVTASGEIKDEKVVSSTGKVFNNVSLNATRQFKCKGQGADVRVTVPYSFKLAD